MPELPDVEVFKRYLSRTGLKKNIVELNIEHERVLNKSKQTFRRHLIGNQLIKTHRHGKYLFAHISDGFELVFHFGMTGNLKYFKGLEDAPRHSRLKMEFDNGFHLSYVSQRMLGWVDIAKDVDTLIKKRKLGPDALDMDKKDFIKLFEKRRGFLKSALMDQHFLSGVGNIYADEVLYMCGFHPKTSLKRLVEKDFESLHDCLNQVLETAINRKANPSQMPSSYLLPHRRHGGKCPKDGSNLETVKVNQRTSYYCPKHQRKK